MTEIEKLYLNYLDMTTHLPGERMTLEEYKKARKFAQGVMAETDAARIIESEAIRIADERLKEESLGLTDDWRDYDDND